MVGIAVAGLVVALLGTVVAWRLVGGVHSTLDETLRISGESLETLEDTVAVADVVVADLAVALEDLDSALTELEQGMGEARPLLADVSELTGVVPDALGRFQSGLDDVAAAAAEVDQVLGELGALPLAPDLPPGFGLSDQMEGLSAELDPIIAALRSSSANLERLSTTTADLQGDVAALAGDVEALDQSLSRSSQLVGDYRDQAGRANRLAVATRDDLDERAALMRGLILAGGLLFAVSQFVPLWVGLELLDGTGPRRTGEDGGDVTPSGVPDAASTGS